MNEGDAHRGLTSPLPSQRMKAAMWLLNNPPKEHSPWITDALSKEVVPRIRVILEQITDECVPVNVDAHISAEHPGSTGRELREPDQDSTLNYLASLIRHETEPAIGWIRHAANAEIEDFTTSRTNQMIQALRNRILGLAAIADASRAPLLQPISLHECIRSAIPVDVDQSMLEIDDGPTESDRTIQSDHGLLSLIIGNAIQNAIDASSRIADNKSAILVNSGMNDSNFWLTITNRFSGQSFRLAEVSRPGLSSKGTRRGLGVESMRLASNRLGYSLDLNADGGIAVFMLKGPHRNA